MKTFLSKWKNKIKLYLFYQACALVTRVSEGWQAIEAACRDMGN